MQRESNPEILSEEEASRLWERAAQLQAEASGTSEPTDVQTTALPAPGYSLAEVRSAALEASIGEKFFEAALVDLRSERTLPAVGRGGKLARRFLKNPPSTITVQRILEATPQTVFAAMEAVLPEEPFRLTLTDQEGDPLNQGLLVFNLPEVPSPLARGFAFEARDGGLQRIFILQPCNVSQSRPRPGGVDGDPLWRGRIFCGMAWGNCPRRGRRNDWTWAPSCGGRCRGRRCCGDTGISSRIRFRHEKGTQGPRRACQCSGS